MLEIRDDFSYGFLVVGESFPVELEHPLIRTADHTPPRRIR